MTTIGARQRYWHIFPCDVTPPPDIHPAGWHEVLVQILAVPGPPDGQRAGVVYVWLYDHAAGQAEQVFFSAVDRVPLHLPSPYAPRFQSRVTLDTAAGPLTVEKASGCGCRNPLKHLDPLAGQ